MERTAPKGSGLVRAVSGRLLRVGAPAALTRVVAAAIDVGLLTGAGRKGKGATTGSQGGW